MTFANDNNTRGIYEMATMNDDQGTLLNNEQQVTDDYVLSFRHRQSQKRSLRLCFCCTFLSALSFATIFVLMVSFIFHPNNEKQYNETVEIEFLWTSAFPKLLTETAFRLVDCNSDGILDIIFGYGTGVDTLADNRLLCDLHFNGIYPCNGGVKVKRRRRGN